MACGIMDIWKVRNDRIFSNLVKEFGEIVNEIKVLSWNWAVTRLKSPPCLYGVGTLRNVF